MKVRNVWLSTLFIASCLPGFVTAASLGTDGCLGVSGFNCHSDGEFNNGPLSDPRAEHAGTLIPTSMDFTGTVSGHADISMGTLSSNGAVTSNPSDPSSQGLDGGVIFGNSSFNDNVTFTNSLIGDFDVTINMYVSGNIVTDGATASAGAFLNVAGQTDFGSYFNDGPIDDVLTATVTLTNSDTINISGSVSYSVDEYPGGAANTDLSVSAYFELILVDEAVFISESTHFLTAPVPVPPALQLFIAGVASLIGLSRRKTQ